MTVVMVPIEPICSEGENKSMKVLNTVFGSVAAMGTMAILLGAAIPDDKKELKIDNLDGKKGAVVFKHGKHAEEFKTADGKDIVCKSCHHTLEADEPADVAKVKVCKECHVLPGETQKEHGGKTAPFLGEKKSSGKFDKKKILMHTNCGGCHKKQEAKKYKKLKKCKNCHTGDKK